MDEEASLHMDSDGHIEVTFSVSDAEFSTLRSALRATFHGYPYFADEA